ncbi:MAG: hypothetical protein P1U58_13870 [Verrucomicrobiales bacterium]|nr:hypothetical protein [Verrucomicrobiales bacterium]
MDAFVKTDLEEVNETLEDGSSWLKRKVTHSFLADSPSISSSSTEIQLIAIPISGATPQGMHDIGTISPSELYSWSDAPVFDLFNDYSELQNILDSLKTVIDDLDEFEFVCTDFWRKILSLTRYLGASPGHDEVISSLIVIPPNGGNSYLDIERIKALQAGFSLVNHKMKLSETTRDEFIDLLEQVGFDVNFPLSFSENGA